METPTTLGETTGRRSARGDFRRAPADAVVARTPGVRNTLPDTRGELVTGLLVLGGPPQGCETEDRPEAARVVWEVSSLLKVMMLPILLVCRLISTCWPAHVVHPRPRLALLDSSASMSARSIRYQHSRTSVGRPASTSTPLNDALRALQNLALERGDRGRSAVGRRPRRPALVHELLTHVIPIRNSYFLSCYDSGVWSLCFEAYDSGPAPLRIS